MNNLLTSADVSIFGNAEVSRSVGLEVTLSVGWSVCPTFTFLAFCKFLHCYSCPTACSSSPQSNLHIALRQKKTNKSRVEGVVSTLFLPFDTGRSSDHAKDKNYVIFTPILLQRQSAFSALAKKAALAFAQLAELPPLFGKKNNKNTKNINSRSNIHAIGP